MLGRALESLVRQETHDEFRFEIVVIDDGSTDGTRDVVDNIVKQSAVPVRYVREQGRGVAGARNAGVTAASGEWIAFFDDDQLADPDWLMQLYAVALEKRASCVGGSRFLCLPEGCRFPLSPICRALLGEEKFGDRPKKAGRKTEPSTGNLLVRRDVCLSVGMFDEATIRGGEDIEFTARLRKAGIELWYAPRAVVHHLIPEYRLTKDYFFRLSLRIGDNFAYRDYREWGLARTAMLCVARMAQTFVVHLPLMLLAYTLGDGAEVLGRKCMLLKCWGYLRQLLYLFSPHWFSQETHFSQLSFRGERAAFAGITKTTELCRVKD